MFLIIFLILTTIVILALRLIGGGVSDVRKVIKGKDVTSKTIVSKVASGVSTFRNIVLVLYIVIGLSLISVFSLLLMGGAGFAQIFITYDEDGSYRLDADKIANFSYTRTSSETRESDDKKNTANMKSKPEGISDESWKSADDVGRAIAAFASDAILNPPNGNKLIYRQGDTPVGYADCSVFVCASIEGGVKRTFAGVEAPNGYDFSINKKSDLQGYNYTGGMRSVVSANSACNIGSVGSSIDKAQPGDIILSSSHVMIYVGKRESDGAPIYVHSSMPGGLASTDIACSDPHNDCGFTTWAEGTIYRLQILWGN